MAHDWLVNRVVRPGTKQSLRSWRRGKLANLHLVIRFRVYRAQTKAGRHLPLLVSN